MEGMFLAARHLPLIENETIPNYLRLVLASLSEYEEAALFKAVGHSGNHAGSPLYPRNLQTLREFIRSLPSLTEMLRSNTGVDVMRLTVSSAEYERFYRHSVFGERQPIAVLCGISRNRAQRGLTDKYFENATCPECIDEDKVAHGRTFVRRQWAYSKIAVCTRHRVSLMTACSNCRSSVQYKDSLHRLRSMCVCNEYPLVQRANSTNCFSFDSDFRVAQALDSLFRLANNATLDSRHTRYVYRHQALRLGFLTSSFQYEKISKLGEKKLHPDVLSKHEMKFANGSCAARMLKGDGSLRSPLENAVLVCTLFESTEEFESAMTAAATLADEELVAPVRNTHWRPKALKNKKIEQLKEQARNYVRANPEASRTDVQRSLSYVFRVLSHFEPESFDEILPPKKTPRRTCGPRNAAALENEDCEYEAHVRRRHAAFQRRPPSFRVTKAKLKEGWKGAVSFPTNKWRLPLTVAALEMLHESAEEYKKRKGINSNGASRGKR